MRDFRKLIAWQKAHALAVSVHRIAVDADFNATPGMRSQLLRAVDSVPANIAEGAGKPSELEFARYLDIALGSAREVDNHAILAMALGCIDERSGAKIISRRRRSEAHSLFAVARRPAARAVAHAVNPGSGVSCSGLGLRGQQRKGVWRTRSDARTPHPLVLLYSGAEA
jgi:four helix bundle protein